MRAWCQVTKLIFVVTALAAVARTAIVPSPASLVERMDSGASGSSRIQSLTYEQLENGHYRPDPSYSSMHPATQASHYGETLFHDGKPIFRFRQGGNPIALYKLHQAFTDFGGFHAHVSGSDRVLTVSNHPRHPGTAFLQAPADPYVIQGAQRVEQTSRTFGRNAAIMAHGWGASSVPMKKKGMFGKQKPTREAPSWEEIRRSSPVSSNADLSRLRGKRDQDRFLRFMNTEGTLSLGVRASASGQIEHELYNMLEHHVIFRGL